MTSVLRAGLSLNQPRQAIESGLRALLSAMDANADHRPLLEDVMMVVRAFRISAVDGLDAPLGLALLAAEKLVAAGALLASWHVQELSEITRLAPRLFPNERDAASRILAHAGREVRPPVAPEKPKPPAPKSLDEIRAALQTDQGSAVIFHIRKLKAADVSPDPELLALVEKEIRRDQAQPSRVFFVEDWLRLAKMLLPSPNASRELYESLANHELPKVKSGARACLRALDK